jgi:hypothetical protein
MLLLGLIACPDPPPAASGPAAAGPPAVAGPAPGASPAGAPEAGGVAPQARAAKFSQDDLAKDPDAVEVSGEIACEPGRGPFLVRIFLPPPTDASVQAVDMARAQVDLGPVAMARFDGPGPFSLRSPKGAQVTVEAFEDRDGDGVPGRGEFPFFAGGANPRALDLTGPTAGLELDCADASAAPPPGATGGPAGPTGPAGAPPGPPGAP